MGQITGALRNVRMFQWGLSIEVPDGLASITPAGPVGARAAIKSNYSSRSRWGMRPWHVYSM